MAENNTQMLCCLCGASMQYNAAAMCVTCLRGQVDITDGIKRHLECLDCGKCGRWHVSGDHWMHMELESVVLMQHCIKKMALDKREVRIIDTTWIWTEPHSKRLKVAVDIEKEVMNVKLQQRVVVEFVIRSKQCMECIRENTDHTWGCIIQVRQRVGGGKASLYKLETLLMKSGMSNLILDVTVRHEGLDMFFKSKNQAERVCDLIMTSYPTRKKLSAKMVSQDDKSHTKRMEHTILLEIAPIQKNDLLILPRGLSGGKPDLVLCHKLSSNLHMVSPLTLQRTEISSTKFFQAPFGAQMRNQQLVEFVVLDINPVAEPMIRSSEQASRKTKKAKKGDKMSKHDGDREVEPVGAGDSAAESSKPTIGNDVKQFQLAEAEVVRSTDFGTSYTILTHLGHLLAPGDTAAGYFLAAAALADDELDQLSFAPPDVVLVRKVYDKDNGRRRKNKGARRQAPWRRAKDEKAGGDDNGEGFSKVAAASAEDVEDVGDDLEESDGDSHLYSDSEGEEEETLGGVFTMDTAVEGDVEESSARQPIDAPIAATAAEISK